MLVGLVCFRFLSSHKKLQTIHVHNMTSFSFCCNREDSEKMLLFPIEKELTWKKSPECICILLRIICHRKDPFHVGSSSVECSRKRQSNWTNLLTPLTRLLGFIYIIYTYFLRDEQRTIVVKLFIKSSCGHCSIQGTQELCARVHLIPIIHNKQTGIASVRRCQMTIHYDDHLTSSVITNRSKDYTILLFNKRLQRTISFLAKNKRSRLLLRCQFLFAESRTMFTWKTLHRNLKQNIIMFGTMIIPNNCVHSCSCCTDENCLSTEIQLWFL